MFHPLRMTFDWRTEFLHHSIPAHLLVPFGYIFWNAQTPRVRLGIFNLLKESANVRFPIHVRTDTLPFIFILIISKLKQNKYTDRQTTVQQPWNLRLLLVYLLYNELIGHTLIRILPHQLQSHNFRETFTSLTITIYARLHCQVWEPLQVRKQ